MRPDIVLPSTEEPVVAELSLAIGGPPGRHARIGGNAFWTPIRVLLALTMLTFVAGFLVKVPCRTHGWADNYQYTRMCYSDVFALYFSEHLDEGKVPYADHAVEYPVVIGGVMYVVSELVDTARDFFDVTSLLLLGCALIVTAATMHTAGRRRPWDAALVAVAPGLVLHATTNWDLIAVAFAALGMWAWSRDQPGIAGIWWGVGVATKLYPLLFFGPLLLLCWRARRLREWSYAAAGGALAWLVINLPVWRAHPDAWGEFYRLNRTRPADWDSLHFLVREIVRRRIDPTFDWDVSRLNQIVFATFLVAVVALAVLIVKAPRRPRVAQVFFLVVAAFLLSNKVNSPQYTLWLIPLAVLARPRWGAFLAWQVSEIFVMATRYYFFVNQVDPPAGMPVTWFLGAVFVRDVLLVWLMALVVRDIWRPEADVVRRDGTDDPAGGPLDRALDRRDVVDDEWVVPATA